MTQPRSSRVLIILAFAAVYVVWGSTYLGIRYAIETLPPFLMAGTRFSLAGAILFTWAMLNGESIRSSFSQWPKALAIGGLLLLGGNGGVTWAEKYIPSGFAALLIATEPLWVVVLNWALSHTRPNGKVLLGVFIGMAGVALLVGDGLRVGITGSSIGFVGVGVMPSCIFGVGSRFCICESISDQGFDFDGIRNADVGRWQFATGACSCSR